MKDEIKEALDEFMSSYYADITHSQYELICDYITNLEQENEKLKEENEHLRTDLNTYQNTIIEVNKECNSLFNHLTKKDLDYKSRIDKATGLLKKYGNGTFDDDLLKILGGDEE